MEEEVMQESEQQEISSEVEDLSLISDYLLFKGSWELQTDIPNDDLLGDILEVVIDAAFPPKPQDSFPPGPHYLPLKLIILGPDFSGRHTLAKKLTDLYGIKVFEMNKILEDRQRAIERKAELDEGKKPKKTAEEESEIFTEVALKVSAEKAWDRARLIRGKLRGIFGDELKIEEENKKPAKKDEVKSQGYCLLGYPITLEDAITLEKEQSGFVHPKYLPEPISKIKQREAYIIAKPSLKSPPPPPKFKSAFDLCIMLEVPLNNILRRALDRRLDHQGNMWNLTYKPPPDNLLNKLTKIEKPTEDELTESHIRFETNKPDLVDWFDNFAMGQASLLRVEGDMSIDSIWEMVNSTLQKIIANKASIDPKPAQASPPMPSASNQLNPPSQRNLQDAKPAEIAKENTESQATISLIETQTMPETYITMKLRHQEFTFTLSQVQEIYDMYCTIRSNYLSDLKSCMNDLNNFSQELSDRVSQLMQDFKDYLCRDDTKQGMVNEFVVALNQAIGSFDYFVRKEDKQAVIEEIVEFSDTLWDVIDFKKEEAIKERERIIKDGPESQLLERVMLLVEQIVQIELNKFNQFELLKHKFNTLGTSDTDSKPPEFNKISLNVRDI